jgi:DNA-binding transcriptional regulator YiaG
MTGLPTGATVTGKEFKRAIKRLNVSQLGAGRLLGVDGRTIRAWIADDSRIPNAVAILIRLAIAGKITLQDIEAVADRPKPRK